MNVFANEYMGGSTPYADLALPTPACSPYIGLLSLHRLVLPTSAYDGFHHRVLSPNLLNRFSQLAFCIIFGMCTKEYRKKPSTLPSPRNFSSLLALLASPCFCVCIYIYVVGVGVAKHKYTAAAKHMQVMMASAYSSIRSCDIAVEDKAPLMAFRLPPTQIHSEFAL